MFAPHGAPRFERLAIALGIAALLLAGPAAGQSAPTSPASVTQPPAPPAPPSYPLPGTRSGPAATPQNFRWVENWSAQPADDAPLLERIKHLPLLAPSVYLTLGGELRAYYTDWHHTALGRTSKDDNHLVQTRLRLLADLHVGANARAYVELGDNREHGEQFATTPNRDELDVYQAFVDLSLPVGKTGKLTARPGRFEMPLGNGKLVGVREGLNMRFTYQGGRLTYLLPGKFSIDVFAVRPVNIKPGTFDDGPSHSTVFHGVYVSSPKSLFGFGTDLYWYEMKRARGTLTQGSGRDNRNSWGARAWRRLKDVDLDVEAAFQTGSFAGKDIRAFALLAEGGYSLPQAPLKPRFGLRANLFSGDDNLGDGVARTFIAASPRLPLISEAAFFNMANLMDIYPSVTIKPSKTLMLMAGPDLLWRHRKADGIYIGPAGASFTPYVESRYIGTNLNLEATWQATKRLQFRLFETYFVRSGSFARHGGRDGNYFGIFGDYRF